MLQRIKDMVENRGPMFFDDYMEMCLYDPEAGFFASGPVRSGKKADFVTSPELTWAFGLCVGDWADANRPTDRAALIEFGSGSGKLLGEVKDLWNESPGLVYAVERSAASRDALMDEFDDVIVIPSLDVIPRGTSAVVFANEMLDNIPAALAVRRDDAWMEIAVGVEGDEMSLVEVQARNDVASWCDEVFGSVDSGTVVSAQLGVSRWISELTEHLGTISLCLIDYGDTSERLLEAGIESVVRSYRRHRGGIDWLKIPGECDITVDVNFTALLIALRRAGLEPTLSNQRAFCLEYGIAEVIADARDREQIAAKMGKIMNQLEVRSERLDFEALVDPNGLGGFKVLLVES